MLSDHSVERHVAETRQFVADVAWQWVLGTTHQHIWLHAKLQELLDRVLRFGFQFSRSGQVGDQVRCTTKVSSGDSHFICLTASM